MARLLDLLRSDLRPPSWYLVGQKAHKSALEGTDSALAQSKKHSGDSANEQQRTQEALCIACPEQGALECQLSLCRRRGHLRIGMIFLVTVPLAGLAAALSSRRTSRRATSPLGDQLGERSINVKLCRIQHALSLCLTETLARAQSSWGRFCAFPGEKRKSASNCYEHVRARAAMHATGTSPHAHNLVQLGVASRQD